MSFIKFDFNDQSFLWLIVSLSAILLLMIISFIILKLFFRNENKYLTHLSDSSSSARIYVLDLKNDSVSYFNRSSLREMKKSSIIDFYNQFSANSRITLVKWVDSLLDQKAKANNYLELNVIERKKKRLVYSILQVQKIDYENKLIHLESNLLRVKSNRSSNPKNFLRFSSSEAFSKAISSASHKKGVTFVIDLYYRNPEFRSQEFSRLAYAQVKNFVLNYASPRCLIMEYGERQLIVTNLDLATNSQTLRFIAELKSKINRILTISAFSDEIAFLFAIVNNKTFPRDPEKIINAALTTAQLSEDADQQINWFDPDRSLEISNEQNIYRTEVERIIRDNKLSFKYRPIYHSEKGRTVGYELLVKPSTNTMFESIEALKGYAIKTGDDKELFSAIAKKGISRFIQEKDGVSLRLFFPVSFKERTYIARTLSYIQRIKESHIVIVFSQDELQSLVNIDEGDVLNTLNNLKIRGYEVAIELSEYELPFSKQFYQAFDFYMLNVPYVLTDKNGPRSLSNLRAFAEKLLHNNKTIVVKNVNNWDTVELLIRLGLGIVSANCVADYNEMLLPTPKKSIVKIKRIVEDEGA